MSPVLKGEARRHQLVTTYGIGSVVALGDESFMVAGIDFWRTEGPNIHEPRLERELGVAGFVDPPASGDDRRPDVPVVRFPMWHSCPSCGRLAQHYEFTTYDGNRCGVCDELLIPSRFVVACQNGHIDDFPYFSWVHAGSQPNSDVHEMTMMTTGMTASLRDVVVSCSCGKEMTLDGAFRAAALRGISGCTGRRPWLRARAVECHETPRTLQRGASNVWHPVLKSALSIPPWSEGAFRRLNKYWGVLKAIPDDALAATLSGMPVVHEGGYSVDQLVEAVRRRKQGLDDPAAVGPASLRREEYEALVRGRTEDSGAGQDFVCEPVDIDRTPAARWLSGVMAVRRLREVRALQSFTRVLPPSGADAPDRRARLFESNPGWLPAIEVTGEGVFLALDRDRVARWESDSAVAERLAVIDDKYRGRFHSMGKESDRAITPRLILLHSLAHLLIGQWSLECGYPAAALRERIYASDDTAGVLIYTATTDSAGSLGGVVALSEPGRLVTSISEMAERARWCSSDPLCSESTGSGIDGLNLAACHSCLLLPEVSCEEMNVLLDRAAVVATPGAPDYGYLEEAFD